jgi:tRNA(His) 5'-end guanylyltransferase
MNFDKLDKIMRVYETNSDQCVLPGIFMVARIDGRSFSRLTKDVCNFEAPYDVRFRDIMVETVKHLMQCGFRVIYGYTQSDEISLLFHRDEDSFKRKLRKYHSILAGEASAKFTSLLGQPAAFDCRISQLPDPEMVVDYFRWRMEDAHRNCLNGHCYWMLRKQGQEANAASTRLLGMSVSAKNELLFQNGINYNDLPVWQKRGIGFYWQTVPKAGVNPQTGEKAMAERQEIKVDFDIPWAYPFDKFLLDLIDPKIFIHRDAVLIDEPWTDYNAGDAT